MSKTTEMGWRLRGLAPCCGTTNHVCVLPPGVVRETPTGCEKCGHPKACHAWSQSA